ncbi:MAG: DegT/DnrJ/EryC1/StrS family aminotransferase [Phycisphaeraceae bacterium]|nr:DegT/DnrJ/EryC1/StrS family aminotransferase [Phycisphaeraceae bacterium]
MAVPILDLSRQHQPLAGRFKEAFDRILSSSHFILGPEVEAFERRLASYCQTTEAVGVSSGADALLVALMAMGIGPGDEVIVPTFTFFATAGAVARVGARAVFVDVDPQTFNIDPQRAAAAVTPRTKAMIPVHLFGQTAAMDPLLELARKHGLKVIEDEAQAVGAREKGRSAGSFGDVGCISFYPTKNLSAMGDGGACVTSDGQLAQRIRALRNHGQVGEYEHLYVGGNFRLDALQAAMLSIKLEGLEGGNAARRECAGRYDRLLAGLPLRTPVVAEGRHHVYHQYTIVVPADRREGLIAHLKAHQIGCKVFYPLPLHLQPCFAGLGGKKGDCPVSEELCRQVLSLPMFPGLRESEQEEVAGVIRKFFRG